MSVHITYFVHGTTTDNETERGTGWLPGELSAKGIEQSRVLRSQIPDTVFDVVFCSDLQRAIDSATITFGDAYMIVQDDRLRECNYGDLNGAEKPSFGPLENYIDTPYPNGESYRDVEQRMADFCTFLLERYDGKQVAIVAHQAPQLALDVLLRGRTWKQAIAEDWRKNKAWQPGWSYEVS